MSEDARISPWGHRALNLALMALAMALMALLYAGASKHLGAGASSPRAASGGASPAQPAGERASSAGQAQTSAVSTAEEIVQVGVRNGCGEGGVAAETRGHLVRAGFDVVEVGNYSTFDLDSSVVIDRVGNLAAARRLARAMGIPEARVRQEIGEAYYLDATVVLGADYRSLAPFDDDGRRAAR